MSDLGGLVVDISWSPGQKWPFCSEQQELQIWSHVPSCCRRGWPPRNGIREGRQTHSPGSLKIQKHGNVETQLAPNRTYANECLTSDPVIRPCEYGPMGTVGWKSQLRAGRSAQASHRDSRLAVSTRFPS